MLLTLSNSLKVAGVAALLSLGLAGASARPAAADTFQTRCSGDDCYRVRCDDFGYDCVNIGYVGPERRDYQSRWVCDEDGDNCHWARRYNSPSYGGFYDRDDEDTYPF